MAKERVRVRVSVRVMVKVTVRVKLGFELVLVAPFQKHCRNSGLYPYKTP